MPSRQDQLHSYQFMVQRVVSALVMRETDPPRSPFRRLAGSTLIGVLLAALGFGGAAAYAVISPRASTAWRDENAVIVEKETGALYLYRDQRLQPVLNFPSALLILNAPAPRTVAVSRASLAGVPRSAPVGIVGAPATLPSAAALSGAAWTVCSSSSAPVLFVGGSPGGSSIGARAVLANGPDGTVYLLFRGRKHLIRDAGAVLIQLAWNTKPRVPVAPEFLDGVPAGADVRRPVLAAATRFVQVESSYFASAPDGGFVALTPFQYRLMHTGEVSSLSLYDFQRLAGGHSAILEFPADLPTDIPEILDVSGQSLCSRGTELSAAGALSPSPRVVVRPGSAAVVVAVAAPGAAPGEISLVTDLGRRHAVPSAEALAALGYGSVTPVPVPSGLLAMVPEGPALDPAAARSCPNCR